MLRRAGYALIAALIVALVALNALAWTGGLVEEAPSTPTPSEAPQLVLPTREPER